MINLENLIKLYIKVSISHKVNYFSHYHALRGHAYTILLKNRSLFCELTLKYALPRATCKRGSLS